MDIRDVHLALALGCKVPDARRYRRNADALRGICDVWAMEPGTMAKLKAPGCKDLVVERLGDARASITHYGEQNGDLMSDPDVVLELAPDASWVRAFTFRNDYVGIDRDYFADGDAKEMRSLNAFLASWLSNLRSQGLRRADASGEGG